MTRPTPTATEDRVRTALDHVAQHTETSPDALERLAARRRPSALRRALPYATGIAAAFAALAFVVMGRADVPPADVTSGDTATTGSTGEATASDDATIAWGGLDRDGALDALADIAADAPPPPPVGPGERRVQQTTAVWSATTVEADGSDETILEVVLHEVWRGADGTISVVRETLGEVESSGDPDVLQQRAAAVLEGFDRSTLTVESLPDAASTSPPGPGGEGLLDIAEREAAGDPEPVEGTTERPDHAHAVMTVADGFRDGLEPAERARAFGILRSIDGRYLAYEGPVEDLRGREGVGFAYHDPANPGSPTVLIFSTDTGELLGNLGRHSAESTAPPIGSYTSMRTFVEPVD